MLTFVKIVFEVSIMLVVALIVELLFTSESVELVIVSNILLEVERAFVIAIEIVFEFTQLKIDTKISNFGKMKKGKK